MLRVPMDRFKGLVCGRTTERNRSRGDKRGKRGSECMATVARLDQEGRLVLHQVVDWSEFDTMEQVVLLLRSRGKDGNVGACDRGINCDATGVMHQVRTPPTYISSV